MTRKLFILTTIFFLVFFNGCYSPREKKLREEKARLEKEYKKLSNELDSLDMQIKKLNERDSILMNSFKKDSIDKK